jgi:hypothetical protein
VHTLSGVAGPGQRGASKTFRDLPQTIDCVYDGFGVGLNYIVASPVLVSFGTAVQRAAVDIAADQVVRTTVRGTSDARLVTGEDQGSSFAELAHGPIADRLTDHRGGGDLTGLSDGRRRSVDDGTEIGG